MYIQTDDNDNIIQVIEVGSMPEKNGYEIDSIPDNVLENPFDYKYIDGNFTLKENLESLKIQQLKQAKIQNMNVLCNQIIVSGFDFKNEHYSLFQHDQINLADLKNTALNGDSVVYHSDGNLCKTYSPEEFLSLINAVSNFKKLHTTYFNFLKSKINSAENIDEILEIHYGSDVSDEFENLVGNTEFEIPDIPDVADYSFFMR